MQHGRRHHAGVIVDDVTWRRFRALTLELGTTVELLLGDLVRAELAKQAKRKTTGTKRRETAAKGLRDALRASERISGQLTVDEAIAETNKRSRPAGKARPARRR